MPLVARVCRLFCAADLLAFRRMSAQRAAAHAKFSVPRLLRFSSLTENLNSKNLTAVIECQSER